MSAPDPILFDLDGTLVDSREAFARSVNAALAAHGLPTRAESELHAFLGPPIHETFVTLGVSPGASVQACVDVYRARYRAHGAEESRLFEGIPDVLDRLGTARPLLVATSKPWALAEPLLDALGIRDRFAAVVGPELAAENESKATTVRRALTTLDALDGPRASRSRPVMVGDRRHDIEGAKANGLRSVGVLWGIGGAAELTDAGADTLARRPVDLIGILDGRPPEAVIP